MFDLGNFGEESPSWFFKLLNFSKMHSGNLSQIILPNMQLLVLNANKMSLNKKKIKMVIKTKQNLRWLKTEIMW